MKVWTRDAFNPIYVKRNTNLIFKHNTDDQWYAHFISENNTILSIRVADIAQIEED